MEKILRTNCLFTCPQLIGVIFITPPEPAVCSGGIPVFTDKARLYGVGLCEKKPIPPPGSGFLPCTLIAAGDWVAGVDYRKRINGRHVLNASALQICLGDFVTSKPLPVPIPFPGHDALRHIAEWIQQESDASESDAENESESEKERRREELRRKIERDILSDAGEYVFRIAQEQRKRRTLNEETTARPARIPERRKERIPEGQEERIPGRSDSLEGAVSACEYCGRRENCEYLKTPCGIEPQLVNASAKLRKNAPDKALAYTRKAEALSREYGLSWSLSGEAHHILSKAVFASSRKLCKLANFYGYDINGAENCILLPSPAKDGEFGQRMPEAKTANAYEVMGITGAQWHSGPHEYRISRESHQDMVAAVRKYVERSGGSLSAGSELENYFQLARAECLKLERIVDKTFSCCVENQAANRERFHQLVNRSIGRIEERLLAFAENKKKSYPYYVSRLSFLYAFDLPRTGKAILIRRRDGKRIYEKRVFRLSEKGGGRPSLTKSDERVAEETDTGELITFCGNTVYFFIEDDAMSYRPPFEYKTRLYYIVHAADGWKLYHNGNPVRLMARQETAYGPESLAMYLLIEKQEDTDSYLSPRLAVNQRKKERGLS
ncbi:MAG: AHH domain-containing protein [Oscillibacter sp.]|nr:AHH domain-containing protein [Oscillibacter sp.]